MSQPEMSSGGSAVKRTMRASGPLSVAASQLGEFWAEALRSRAQRIPIGRPWWKQPRYQSLITRLAPHLPELFMGLAKGAGVHEDCIGTQVAPDPSGGCTSFALEPHMTQDGVPLAGQNKDTPISRQSQFQIIAFEPDDAPHFLTLTYPGWLFGHGFVAGGCTIFRNQLYAGAPGGLPYATWGLLALHCRDVHEVIELTREWGVAQSGHLCVMDEAGEIVGVEATSAGVRFLSPRQGVYAHANAVRADPQTAQLDPGDATFTRQESLLRDARLHELLLARSDWTCESLFGPLSDHANAPTSICRHERNRDATTTASVVADPRRRRLCVALGPPCITPMTTFQLCAAAGTSDSPSS